jgi:hypothetical protein
MNINTINSTCDYRDALDPITSNTILWQSCRCLKIVLLFQYFETAAPHMPYIPYALGSESLLR